MNPRITIIDVIDLPRGKREPTLGEVRRAVERAERRKVRRTPLPDGAVDHRRRAR